MIKALTLALLIAIAFGSKEHLWLGCKTYDDAYRAVDHLLTKDEGRIPQIIRLVFHDCVGKSCDGCINFQDVPNRGVTNVTFVLDEIRKPFEHVISRADFWQLAANVALVRSGLRRKCHAHDKKHCSFFDLQFWWGRKDCHTSPHSHHHDDPGNPHGDFAEVRRVLHGNFGLDDKEIVTLMGAHSVGGAHKAASGWEHNWQEDFLTFDNQYYKNMITLPYIHIDVNKSKHETEEERREEFVFFPSDKKDLPLLMLNVDMSLWKDVKAVKDKEGVEAGDLTCKTHHHEVEHIKDKKHHILDECKEAHTAHEVYEYAHNLEQFFHDFTPVWFKMVSHGYEHHKLHVPGFPHEKCGYCIPHGATCEPGFDKAGQCCPGSHCEHKKCV